MQQLIIKLVLSLTRYRRRIWIPCVSVLRL